MNPFLKDKHDEQEESHWLSVSDLMAGLMMVFLFISVALMRDAFIERDKIKQVAVTYQENQVAIYEAMHSEFKKDLKKWNAEIDNETLTFTFKSPDVLFESGKSDLNYKYKSLLNDFFPRYMKVLGPFKLSINEVRIEGHTSSFWGNLSDDRAYFKNMDLSQERTRSVLRYVYFLPQVHSDRTWIKKHIAAVGFSSSHLIYEKKKSFHGHLYDAEDAAASRRVSFRVITNADIKIKEILESSE